MADQIRVSGPALENAVGDLAAGVASAGTRLEDLKASIAPMVASWEGSAQQSYAMHQAKWDTAWNDLTAALGVLQRTTATSNADYASGEAANAASWG